jgi:hypothetical protein
LGGNFLSQVSYSGVETKDTNSEFKILKLGKRFGSAPPTPNSSLLGSRDILALKDVYMIMVESS